MANNKVSKKSGRKDHQSLTPNKDTKERIREKWLRRVGKVGCGIFVILVALFFDIPENVKNLYLGIALLVVGWDIVFRDVKSLINLKNGEKLNVIELMVMAFTITAVVLGQFTLGAIFITIYETIETVKSRHDY